MAKTPLEPVPVHSKIPWAGAQPGSLGWDPQVPPWFESEGSPYWGGEGNWWASVWSPTGLAFHPLTPSGQKKPGMKRRRRAKVIAGRVAGFWFSLSMGQAIGAWANAFNIGLAPSLVAGQLAGAVTGYGGIHVQGFLEGVSMGSMASVFLNTTKSIYLWARSKVPSWLRTSASEAGAAAGSGGTDVDEWMAEHNYPAPWSQTAPSDWSTFARYGPYGIDPGAAVPRSQPGGPSFGRHLWNRIVNPPFSNPVWNW